MPRLPGFSGWLWKAALVLLTAAVAVSGFFWLSQSGVFAIEEIIIEGNQTVATEEIMEKAGPLLNGRSLLDYSFSDAAGAAGSFTYIESVDFSRDFPHTIRMQVREHRPFVYLKAVDGKLFLLTDSAMVLEGVESPAAGWPLLITAEPCAVELARRADCADVLAGVEFLASVPVSFNERIVEVTVDDGAISFRTASGATVRFGSPGDADLKFEVARQLIARTVQGGAPVSIDVSVPDRPVTR